MNETEREQVALFRYGLIAPILQGGVQNTQDYLAEVSGRMHQVPGSGATEYSPKTIENWYRLYVAGGFDALKPRRRSDKGESRVIAPELKRQLVDLREQQREISVTLFYERMLQQGIIPAGKVSYHSVYRMLKRLDMVGERRRKEPERKRFQFEKVNQMWQADFSQGPYLRLGKKKVATQLFAFLDDASRLVPYAQYTTDESFDSLKLVLEQALLRRGIPSVIYSDNGKIYRSNQLQWVCACLGIALVHTGPSDPAAKGKIERWFRTVDERFSDGLDASVLGSLDSLNQAFQNWLEQDYNNKPHSALGMSPMQFYLSQVSSLKMIDDPTMLEPLFMRREHRKVHHDSTISVHKLLFEAPPRFIGQRVEVRFDPARTREVFIYEDGKQAARLKPVNLSDNALAKRDNTLRLSSFGNEEAR